MKKLLFMSNCVAAYLYLFWRIFFSFLLINFFFFFRLKIFCLFPRKSNPIVSIFDSLENEWMHCIRELIIIGHMKELKHFEYRNLFFFFWGSHFERIKYIRLHRQLPLLCGFPKSTIFTNSISMEERQQKQQQ